MENNSIKLRLLCTLQAIIKYSDEKHKLKSTQFNEFFKPYGFKHSKKALKDTVLLLNEFGFDVGKRGCGGVWLKEPIISEERLNALIFATQTNPYITAEQAEDALNALIPLISIYKEPLLKSNFVNLNEKTIDDSLLYKYSVINEAIVGNIRIIYKPIYNNTLDEVSEISFIPIKIRQKEDKFYMVGYNCDKDINEMVDLSSISFIKLAVKQKTKTNRNDNEIRENFDYSSLAITIL